MEKIPESQSVPVEQTLVDEAVFGNAELDSLAGVDVIDDHEILDNQEVIEAREIVGWVEQNGIEVDNPEQLARQVESLSSTFGIENDAFDEGRNRLLITAIANELGDEPFGEDVENSERVADMVALAFGEKTMLGDSIERASYEPGFSEERTIQAYDALTDHEVSAQLEAYINADEDFAGVREKLGVTVDSQAPFRVRVLRAGGADVTGGWSAENADGSEDEGGARAARIAKLTDEMLKNKEYLLAETGSDELAPAWVRYGSDGSVDLNILLPTADRLLSSDYGSADTLARDKATVMHELAHTQDRVSRSGGLGLGIAIEEIKAEALAGNKLGYTEVKRYLHAIGAIFGYSPYNYLAGEGVFDAGDLEVDMARNLGLEGYLDIMTIVPPNYANDSSANPFLKAMAESSGDLNDHFNRMYDRATDKFGDEQVAQRISSSVDRAVDIYSSTASAKNGVPFNEGLMLAYKYPDKMGELARADYASRYQAST